MFFEIVVKTGWVVCAVVLFAAVAMRCASLTHHPWATRIYVAARTDAARYGPYTWYVTFWLVSMFVLTVGIVFGVDVVTFTGHWQWIGMVGTVTSAVYSTWKLWPHRFAEQRWLRRIGSVAVGGLVVAGFAWTPGWAVNHVAGFILAVPILIAFCTLRVRTGAVLAVALAVHDGIHVFGTGLMQRFMKPFDYTPFVLYLPKQPTSGRSRRLGMETLLFPA